MRKVIDIGGTKCELKSSAAIPRMYRLKFHRDIYKDLAYLDKQMKVQEKIQNVKKEVAEAAGETYVRESELPMEALELFENIAFLMSVHADPDQPREIEEWLDQFETFDIYQALPEILELWNLENKQMSEVKKNPVTQTGK